MATENITDKNILKSWFKRGLKPLESQFAAWMDSYWHKSEKIPTASVEGLEDTLNQKAESAALDNLGAELAAHAADDTRHKTPEEQSQLAHLAANPNATYATKGQLAALEDNPDVIIIPVDFTTTTYTDDVKACVQPFHDDNSLYEKPVFLRYIYKEDYATPDTPVYTRLITGDCDPASNTKIRFNSPVKVTDVEYPGEPFSLCVEILKSSTGALAIRWNDYKNDDTLIVTLPHLPQGTGEGQQISFSAPGWANLRHAVDAAVSGQKYLLFFRAAGIVCPACLNVKSGTVNRDNKIIEITGTYHLPAGNSITDYSYRILSQEFTYSEKDGLAGVSATAYLYVNDDSGKVFTMTSDNNYNITNPEILDGYVAEKNAGKNPVLLLEKSGFQLLTTSSVIISGTIILATFDLHGQPGKNQESDTENNKMSYSMLTIRAEKQGDAWVCTPEQYPIQINTYDYLKASNIHLVTEYPDDLSTYPDGSIFIKQQP